MYFLKLDELYTLSKKNYKPLGFTPLNIGNIPRAKLQ